MLIISHRPHTDIACMGHVVETIPAHTITHHTTNDDETTNHIASLNAWNEHGADPYTHLVIYEHNNAPPGALNAQDAHNLDLDNTPNHIPHHLHHDIQELQTKYTQIRQHFETQQAEHAKQARAQANHEQDLKTYEHLRQKLGKQ